MNRQAVFDLYKSLHNHGALIIEETEGEFLDFLKRNMEENPLTMNRYFHYKGFVEGFEASNHELTNPY